MSSTGEAGPTTVVSGGAVVTPVGVLNLDVVQRDGRVVALTEPGATSGVDESIDATGCLVLPGGVDPHCHVMSDVAAATRAAALGGTTTVLSFTNPEPGERAAECLLRRKQELGDLDAVVDVGLHAMLNVPDHVSSAELAELRSAGASGVKVFLAYPELDIMWSTRGLFKLMVAAARLGQVVQVHCEEGEVIDELVAAVIASGRKGARLFADTRPPETEVSAVARVLETAAITKATCYLTHLSCAGALDQVRLAHRRGAPALHGEVCLHHLVLDDRCYERDDAERHLVAPPLRPPEHTEALWDALADGTLDTVGSDHSQSRSRTIGELSPDGLGYSYGIAGIGARLPLVLSRGLRRGIPIERLVEVTSANAARAFGHYPRKGVIAPGSDADLVIWDPEAETTVEVDTFDDLTGDSVYAGEHLSGQVRDVLLRGQALVRDGRYLGAKASGSYLASSR